VRDRTTLSPTQQDRLRKEGKFVELHKLGDHRNSRAVVVEEDLEQWMRERVAKRKPSD
jgi:hypothetical protein